MAGTSTVLVPAAAVAKPMCARAHTLGRFISCVVSPVHAAVDSADLVSVLCGVTACCPG
jgi:hypothetical protein